MDIERPDEAKKLQSEWLSLTFVDEKDLALQIWGMFPDGSKIDVTRSTRITYTSDRPAVAVVVVGAAPGWPQVLSESIRPG